MLYCLIAFQVIQINPYLLPSFSKFDKSKISDICNVGMKFFIIQIMGLLLFTVDNLLITHFFGATVNFRLLFQIKYLILFILYLRHLLCRIGPKRQLL